MGGGSAPASPLGQGVEWGVLHSELLGALIPLVFRQRPVPYLAHQPAACGPACTTGLRAVFKCNIACVFYFVCVCVYIYLCVCWRRAAWPTGALCSCCLPTAAMGADGAVCRSPCVPHVSRAARRGSSQLRCPVGGGPALAWPLTLCRGPPEVLDPPPGTVSACRGSTPSPSLPAGGVCWFFWLWAPCPEDTGCH